MSATRTLRPSFSVRLSTVIALHNGTNCGYFSTSATRSNMSGAAVTDASLRLRIEASEPSTSGPRGFQSRKIIAGMMRRTG